MCRGLQNGGSVAILLKGRPQQGRQICKTGMDDVSGLWRRNWIWLAAFVLPAALLLGAYALTGIYPFGGKTLFSIDMSNEYVDYYGWYRSLFTGQGSLFYSFGKALGGNMIGLFAVYLASPLNLLLLLFQPENFDTAVLLLTLLKTGLCGLTCALYLRRSQNAPNWAALIFSLCYALMAYDIVYALNLMWLDGVLLLPLVALGVERLTAGGRPWLYVVTLTLALYTDFYIGYMIAIFIVLFFLYRLLVGEKAMRRRRAVRRLVLRFAAASALAGGLSAPLTVPALLSLRTSKEHLPSVGAAASHAAALRNYGFFDLLHKFSLGAFGGTDAAAGLPNIYCGLLVAVLILLYFWNRHVPARDKLFAALFVGLLVLNFYLSPLNIIWHGFNPPTWFPYRYSFVLCFLLVAMACRAFCHIDGVGRRHVVASCTVLLGMTAVFSAFHYADESTVKLMLSAAFTAVYCMVLLAAARRPRGMAGWPVRVLMPVLCAEFVIGSHLLMGGLQYESRAGYRAYVRTMTVAADALKARDGGFYRSEKTFTRGNDRGDPTFNDSLMFGLNGLSHYSSTDDRGINWLLGRFGYKSNGNWVWYNRGSTALSDALLGVKYLFADGTADQPYTRAASADGIGLYENSYALPVAFTVDVGIVKDTASLFTAQDPFTFQNGLLQAMEPGAADCLTAAGAPTVTLHNCTAVRTGAATRYLPDSAKESAWVEYRLGVTDSGPLYAWFEAASQQGVTVSVNGRDKGTLFDVYHNGVLPLGSFAAGDTMTLRLTLPAGGAVIGDGYFYALDTARLRDAVSALTQGGMTVESFSADHLAGRVQVTGHNRVLFISVPYDRGWTVTVDGKPVRTFRVLKYLTGVSVPAGEHRVVMRYRPPGLTAGCIAGGASLLAAALWAAWGRLRARRAAAGPAGS